MKKFLIIGGGSKLAKCFQDIYGQQSIGLSEKECNITSEQSIIRVFKRYEFDYALNCAAITDIPAGEKEPVKCFDVNTVGPYLLNKICLRFNKKLIQLSSDYAVKPANNYGWSKYLCERVISKDFLVIRTNFYNSETFIVKNLLAGRETKVYRNLYFNPLAINTLVREINKRAETTGLVNLFTFRKISYLQFAYLFCEVFSLNKQLIHPVDYENKNQLIRPFCSYVKSDIHLDIKKDLINFKKFYGNK